MNETNSVKRKVGRQTGAVVPAQYQLYSSPKLQLALASRASGTTAVPKTPNLKPEVEEARACPKRRPATHTQKSSQPKAPHLPYPQRHCCCPGLPA